MIVIEWIRTIYRRLKFWHYTTTPAFKDYGRKIHELEAHSRKLRMDADNLKIRNASIPEVIITESAPPEIPVFSPPTFRRTADTMVKRRRDIQGGAENELYELGDRFDALCNRFDVQFANGDMKAARTTFKALEEIDNKLHHKDKRRVLSQIKAKLKYITN